jgi:hypothetical protein
MIHVGVVPKPILAIAGPPMLPVQQHVTNRGEVCTLGTEHERRKVGCVAEVWQVLLPDIAYSRAPDEFRNQSMEPP